MKLSRITRSSEGGAIIDMETDEGAILSYHCTTRPSMPEDALESFAGAFIALKDENRRLREENDDLRHGIETIVDD